MPFTPTKRTHFQFSFSLLVSPAAQYSNPYMFFRSPSVNHWNLWRTSSTSGKFLESKHWMARNIENFIRADSYVFFFSSKYFHLWKVILRWFSPSRNTRISLYPDSVSKRVYFISLWDPIPFLFLSLIHCLYIVRFNTTILIFQLNKFRLIIGHHQGFNYVKYCHV